MNLVKVSSSNLAAVGWQDGTLRILFQSGKTYDYKNVPASVHGALMRSGSKGEFFKENILGVYEYEKFNPAKESKSVMAKNKQQAAAEARAQAAAPKAAQPVAPVAEQPKVEAPKPAATTLPAPASKQTQTIEKLKEGWQAKGVDLSKLAIKDDGKFKLLIVAEGWPTVQVGPTGGITVVELKSYPKAFDAAMDGLVLYAKQTAREQKKSAGSVTAPQTPAAPAVPQVKPTPTARKAKADAAVEQQLQSA